MLLSFNTASGKYCCNAEKVSAKVDTKGFNTASGKYCCNTVLELLKQYIVAVSIPQAVSTVATAGSGKPVFKRFQKLVLENLKP